MYVARVRIQTTTSFSVLKAQWSQGDRHKHNNHTSSKSFSDAVGGQHNVVWPSLQNAVSLRASATSASRPRVSGRR